MKEPLDSGAQSYLRYLEGDESAVSDIMNELFYGLVYFTDRYVHDIHAAEDIAMDVVSDLFVHRHRYNFKVSLKTYLYMRAKSRALDLLRRRRAIVMTGLAEAEDRESELYDLEGRLLMDERRRAVRGAIDKLPQDMREAVYLVYFERLSYDEAARVMKKSRKQVDNLLYRAKKELRGILGEGGRELL